ncbi:BRI1 kinase inhibitor 1 [Platanthera zijinensis]|uniref:BRI1 kinase inhibitor 1 n=1 Tax=Platanthera zijinensis TaxID=2320716 RepID=A0AAP0AZW9_9ASPA
METETTYIAPPSPLSPAVKPGSPPPPPSLSSSPAHEFSFTICLRPPSPLSSITAAAAPKLSKSSAPSDFDLSPADEIFFHGHLLPLHVLSHPRPNVSKETEQNGSSTNPGAAAAAGTASASGHHEDCSDRTKHRTLSFFFSLRKRLRGGDDSEAEKQRTRKKMMSHVVRLWKKYSGMVEPLLFFKSSKEKREVRRSSYSFSGNSNPRDGGWRRRWQGQFSAPASMRTSPANSGLLVAPPNAFSSSDESTMEELQNAIQAAIAHCKNSIAVKEEKCSPLN